jgi:hypothetical protein
LSRERKNEKKKYGERGDSIVEKREGKLKNAVAERSGLS